MIRELMGGIMLGLGYFTLLPVWVVGGIDLQRPRVARAMVWSLPLTGVLLGLMVVGIALLMQKMGAYGNVLAAIMYPMLYGYVHTEAVMDVSDALHAAHGGKDPYAVIKDPAVGAMGALWGVGMLMTKIALLAYLLQTPAGPLWILVPFASRLGLTAVIAHMSFRSQLVTLLHQSVSKRAVMVATIAVTILVGLKADWGMAGMIVLGIVVSFLTAWRLKRILGFANGDVLGATLEVTEIVLLSAMVFGGFDGIS